MQNYLYYQSVLYKIKGDDMTTTMTTSLTGQQSTTTDPNISNNQGTTNQGTSTDTNQSTVPDQNPNAQKDLQELKDSGL